MKIKLILLLVVASAFGYLFFVPNNILPKFSYVHNDSIEKTKTELVNIRSIGQWEFLSVKSEELVDTVISHTFSNDKLACIYAGTLRLGIDLSEADSSWISPAGNDSVYVKLPKAKLLDEDFLDEASRKVFFQDGSFAPVVLESMAKRAKAKMRARTVTERNLSQVEMNARKQMEALLKAAGYKTVIFMN